MSRILKEFTEEVLMLKLKTRKTGFTLIEVMTVCGLLVIFSLAVFKILVPLIKFWSFAEQKSSVYSSVLTSAKRIQMELRNSSPGRVFIKRGVEPSDILYLHSPLNSDGKFYSDIDFPEKFAGGLGNILWQSETIFYIKNGLHIVKKYDKDIQHFEKMSSDALSGVLNESILWPKKSLLLSPDVTSVVFDDNFLKNEDKDILKPSKKNIVFRINFEYMGHKGEKIKNSVDYGVEIMN